MSVTFHLPSERPLDLVGFAWSPLFEAALSLPVVVHPKRTPMHLPWARRCRELPDDLQEEIRTLAGTFGGFIPGIFEVGLTGDSPAFADELAAFRALDPQLVAFELSLALGGLGSCDPEAPNSLAVLEDPDYTEEVVAAASRAQPGRGELARQVFEDPVGVRDRYADMLARYWEDAFEAEWLRLRPRIETEVTDGARALVTGGIPSLVAELLPEGEWDADAGELVVEKAWADDCDVAERGGMLLVPTHYGWPRVLIELAQPWPVAIIVPLRDLRQPEVPLAADHEVAGGLRALGEETRLQIARLVAEQPRSTTELAELLQLSDSAVSRHLKTLEAAGVVTGERDGYFVLYRLRPERISQLGGALRHTLGLSRVTSGDVPSLPVSLQRAGPGSG